MKNAIEVFGAAENNLKDIDCRIPKNKITLLQGPSGSGKTSLAISTIAAEADYRMQLHSSLTERLSKVKSSVRPQVREIRNLPPVLAFSNKRASSSRQTVASYLGLGVLLFKALQYSSFRPCPICTEGEITAFTTEQIREQIFCSHQDQLIAVAGVIKTEKEAFNPEIFDSLQKLGYSIYLFDGRQRDLDQQPWAEISRNCRRIEVVVDRFRIEPRNSERLDQAIDKGLALQSGGLALHSLTKNGGLQPGKSAAYYSPEGICASCGYCSFALLPLYFSLTISNTKEPYHGTPGKLTALANLTEAELREFLSIKITDLSLEDWCRFSGHELYSHFSRLDLNGRSSLQAIFNCLTLLKRLSLDHLSLLRSIESLSLGEWHRLRLLNQLSSPISGLTYIIDEPSTGLHDADIEGLVTVLKDITLTGNTLLIADHNQRLSEKADFIISLGPAGGENGGQVLFNGPAEEWLKGTGRQLSGSCPQSLIGRPAQGVISLKGARLNNLREINLQIPLNSFVCVTGKSGAGKTSLVLETLAPALKQLTQSKVCSDRQEALRDFALKEITVEQRLARIIEATKPPPIKQAVSFVASYVGVFKALRELYSKLPLSKMRGYSAGSYSLTGGKNKSGKCQVCSGSGFDPSFAARELFKTPLCPECRGLRYQQQYLEVRFKGYSIGRLLDLSCAQALPVLENIPACKKALEMLVRFNLSYLKLGQPSWSLSSGERQRLSLARALLSGSSRNAIYIFDEPSAGLDYPEVLNLADIFKELTAGGSSLIAIEHNLALIQFADHIIDLGPEGGINGGRIVAEGSVQNIIDCESSYTGQALRNYLNIEMSHS